MNGLLPSTKKILTFDEINKIKEKLPELRKKYLEKNPQQQKRATEDKFFDIDEGNISLIPEIGMHTYDYKINEK
ncbi:MAG: hypothetical protein LBO09_08190 [Candidatus Peribacteria bacterium]|jgi:hypothetical protein|nr:hypothetical protein [Candidatus Peribacteria bacterium]